MKILGITDEDFTNYRKPSMFIGMPFCNGKCNEDCGKIVCQNEDLKNAKTIDISVESIVKRYLSNPITKAIVLGAREPMDSIKDLLDLLQELRWNQSCFDDVVIYTGYYPTEIIEQLSCLSKYANVIVKFGRFIPDQKEHFDEVLGVNLASDNQWAEEL